MTTTKSSDNICGPTISAQNPQGNMPEIKSVESYQEEQMEFSLETNCSNSVESDNRVSDGNSDEGVTDSLEEPISLSQPISLPAALCDDDLLKEINSIPDKMGFKIGDVADLLGVKQYILRYWENEFDILKPRKAYNNQRLYTKKDVENVFLIRKLLHRDRFSIEGARSALRGLKSYVRKENQKEKEFKMAYNKMESFHEKLENLAFEIRRIRKLFQ